MLLIFICNIFYLSWKYITEKISQKPIFIIFTKLSLNEYIFNSEFNNEIYLNERLKICKLLVSAVVKVTFGECENLESRMG